MKFSSIEKWLPQPFPDYKISGTGVVNLAGEEALRFSRQVNLFVFCVNLEIEPDRKKLNAFHRQQLRVILNIKDPHQISNNCVYESSIAIPSDQKYGTE